MKKTSNSSRGKPMNLYMRPDDVVRMRELIAYAASNGHLCSPSMLVRAGLRVLVPNRKLLTALKEVEADDLRYRRE